MIDSATYMFSAMLMMMVSGNYNVSTSSFEDFSMQARSMIVDGIRYLASSFFGPIAFLKCSTALLYGSADVLQVSFSERGSGEGRSTRLGVLFSFVGVGCVLGPLLCDRFVNMDEPRTLQRLSILGMGVVSIGLVMTGFIFPFWLILVFTALRSMGSSMVWVYSTLLLQKFVLPQMLGRVTSIDYSAALLTETLSAFAAGYLQDDFGLSAEQVSALLGVFGLFQTVLWVVWDLCNRGAASAAAVELDNEKKVQTALV